ncbi:MAG: DUF2927 domain-containing protein [Rhodobacteraceae bacterium]|nr:DUF2927 domain-containing protein [Paracoccaceae bacterium]
MKRAILPIFLALGACVSPTPDDAPTRAAISESTLPPMKIFAVPQPERPTRSNRDIARDFLDLSFRMESGRVLDTMTRFEGPITVRVTGSPPVSLAPDLTRLLSRLRREAGLNIQQTNAPRASITIEAVPRDRIRKSLPQAACFVAPNVSSLAEYHRARRGTATDWSLLTTRHRLAIFVPNDSSPQDLRDCLHEELAQALGPLNDLYRLSDSVFNDDNAHAVLTGFDMLILRAYYDPSLANGMERREVARRLPTILARINPGGARVSPEHLAETPRSWIDAIQTALGPGAGPAERRRAAATALRIAQRAGWTDHRLGFSHYAYGRLMQSYNAEEAHKHFLLADRALHLAQGPESPHRLYVATQLAAHAISAGRGQEALARVTPLLPVAAKLENATLLSTLMLLRAEALELEGRNDEAANVRLDSLGWARYGFGSDWAVRAKLREIAALSPLKGRY